MAAKDKAKELVRKYSPKLPYYSEKDNTEKSKQCALICVDEILKLPFEYQSDRNYWEEVRNELIKI